MRDKILPAAVLSVILCINAYAGDTDFNSQGDAADAFASSAAQQRADLLVRKMTLDEKLQFIHSQYEWIKVPGGGAGYIQGVPRLGIPDLDMVDSATGSGSSWQTSSTFPATIAVAASWDRRLSYDYGKQVAIQLRAQG
ncbi:glycosyl hydrolase, partial [Burkholderia sp. Bp9142]